MPYQDVYQAVGATVQVLNLTTQEHELFLTLHPTHSKQPLERQAEGVAHLLNMEMLKLSFATRQEPLGADFEKVLEDNRGELYARDPEQ